MTAEPNQRVARELERRKRLFRSALPLARMTAEQFAAKNEVSESFLSRVLAGKGSSQPLIDRIDAFIAKHLKDLADVA